MDLLTASLVFFITCFFSFGVQSLFYLGYKLTGNDHINKHLTVFDYSSGIIGDGALVPLINVFGYFQLMKITYLDITLQTLMICFFGGIVITDMFHHGQAHFDLTNWTMPEKGKWNLLGLYHALFMFFESSFLVLILYSYLTYIAFSEKITFSNSPIIYSVFFLILFFTTFVWDYWISLFKHFYNHKIQPLMFVIRKNRE